MATSMENATSGSSVIENLTNIDDIEKAYQELCTEEVCDKYLLIVLYDISRMTSHEFNVKNTCHLSEF